MPRASALCFAVLLVAEGSARPADADIEAGKAIYREGILRSGRTIQAIVSRDVTVEGRQWRCAACHRRSGLGGTEGGAAVPPVTASALFRLSDVSRIDRFPSLFMESHTAEFRAGARNARLRPAYTLQTLAVALRQGVDPAGRTLDTAMPRYRFGSEDLKDLAAYLELLGRAPAPGVDAGVIHFATVITKGVAPIDRTAQLSILDAWFRQQNREAEYQAQKRGRIAWDMEDEYRASRRWTLDVWEPGGPPETWTSQLAEEYQRQPVFALIGGLASGPWQPIAQFCDHFEVPCLFPETALPGRSTESGHTIYFSPGAAGEASALGAYLRGIGADAGPALQVYRDSPAVRGVAEAFRESFPGAATLALPDGPAPSAEYWRTLIATHRPARLVVWAGAEDVRQFDCGPAGFDLYLSASLVADPNAVNPCCPVYQTYPYALEGNASKARARMKNWQLSRGIAPANDRIQMNAHFALELLDYSIARMNGRFSQDYLIETIERETENSPNPGVFPRLTLGPGQRFASKGAYVVRVKNSPARLERVSGWIVP